MNLATDLGFAGTPEPSKRCAACHCPWYAGHDCGTGSRPVSELIESSRRRFLIGGGVAGLGLLATACPFDGVTRDRAVRYTDIAIGYLKDVLPIVQGIGGTAVADLISRAIPALEKVKSALEKSDFPAAGNFFDTVTSILGQTATALLQLPASDGRMLVIGLLGLAQATLRTVGLFVEKQVPSTAARASLPSGVRAAADESALMKMFEATRFR